MRVIIYIFFLIQFLIGNQLTAQVNEAETNILKSKIEVLYKNKDIVGINKLLAAEKLLEPQYVLEILNRNLQFAKQNNDEILLAKTHIALGNFWHKQANQIKAFEHYLESETIARKNRKQTILATALMNKSTLLENKRERIETLAEASQIFSETKDTLNLIKSLLNTGIAYSQLYAEAVDSAYSSEQIEKFKDLGFKNYSKAEKLNRSFGNNELQGALFIYYGEWYEYEKQYDKAIQAFEKAKDVLRETQNIKMQTYCIFMLAKIALEQKKYSYGIELLHQAEQFSEKNNFNDYLSGIYEEYVKVYSQLGDYKQALKYNHLYAKKSVELTEQSNNDKMQILSLEKDIAENKLKFNKYEADSKLNKILIITILLIALFIAGISYLIIKNNKRKLDSIEKSNIITEIKLKNQQLEDELLKEKIKFSQEHLILFANQVNKIESFLEEMKSKFKKIPGTREEINSLKLSFSELLNGQTQLKQINSLSSELNQDFFFYIRQNYPGISKGDEQLLAYIILDVSSKEISRILNISDKSIYIKRYRLRKKLNLESEETFQDFYQKIISSLS